MATRGRKHNATGRNTGAKPFVMLQNWIFDCPAYRTLKPGPRALLWEVIRRFNGGNNGRIVFSQREMSAAINVSDRETVAGYVRELEARGWIVARRRGGFCVKVAGRRASEWALTMFSIGDELATKEFASWRPTEIGGTEKATSKGGNAARHGKAEVRQHANVRKFPSLPSRSPAEIGTENPPTYTSIAIGPARAAGLK